MPKSKQKKSNLIEIDDKELETLVNLLNQVPGENAIKETDG